MLLRSTAASISRSASGFVRPAAAVRTSAPAPVPGRFRPPSPVLAALTRASASSVRIEDGCPTPVFHVPPFAPKWQLLWPRLTSDDPSRHLSTPVAQGRSSDLPGYCALTFPLMPVGSTSRRSVQELGFASIGLLTPPRRLYPLPVRQASALPSASSRFRLATDTLAVRLTLPLAGCVEDLPLQVRAPCRAHQMKKARLDEPGFLRTEICKYTPNGPFPGAVGHYSACHDCTNLLNWSGQKLSAAGLQHVPRAEDSQIVVSRSRKDIPASRAARSGSCRASRSDTECLTQDATNPQIWMSGLVVLAPKSIRRYSKPTRPNPLMRSAAC